MSLDTLAAAASFVESEDSKIDTNTRGKTPLAMCLVTFTAEILNASFNDSSLLVFTENLSKSPTTSATSDSDSDKSKRRPGGSVRALSCHSIFTV
jgi:hypothetical protein